MAEQFIGEIRPFPYGTRIPSGWAACNGQLLQIVTNQALFSLLGTAYGGNGQTTFGLPNLSGRVPIGSGLPNYGGNVMDLGAVGGEANHTLTVPEMPTHIHSVSASNQDAGATQPTANTWAKTPQPAYAAQADGAMNPASLAYAGDNQPHENMQPYLAVNYCIALVGVYPGRN